MRQRLILLLVLAIMLSGLSGCNILNKPQSSFDLVARKITVLTEPVDAEVIQLRPLGQPSIKLGNTPINNLPVAVIVNVSLKNMPLAETQELFQHSNSVVVKIQKDGYEPHTAVIQTSPAETAVLKVKLKEIEK
jgi:hypothetical protein